MFQINLLSWWKNIKYNIFNPKDFGFDFYGDMIFSSKEFVQNNPKITSDFINATKKVGNMPFQIFLQL